jgi:hypothetical protein
MVYQGRSTIECGDGIVVVRLDVAMRDGGADALRLNNTKRDMRDDRAAAATAPTTPASRRNTQMRK